MGSPTMPSRSTPAAGLLAAYRQALVERPPFSAMAAADVDRFVAACEERYYAPGEVLVEPTSGPVSEIFYIREGAVTGTRGPEGAAQVAFELEKGDLFPLGAGAARRAVTARYSSTTDTFVLVLPVDEMDALARSSPAFADFVGSRVSALLDLSRQALQASYASQTLSQQSLETPLGDLVRRPPLSCRPETPLREALTAMERSRVGSMIVTDAADGVVGILTRSDTPRLMLQEVPLGAPIRESMAAPVHTLTATHTAQDAALLMARYGIRHVPITREDKLAGIVSERDLFALQRLSVRQVSESLRRAPDVAALRAAAGDIRQFARNLLGQGVHARQLTSLVSHLNDVLTQRLLEVQAEHHEIDLSRVCWVALGSEGRSEQTIATDQDNALILPDGVTAAERDAVLAFAKSVNIALDECGYPLCRGGVMAGEPACALTRTEWRERFSRWILHGAPEDLLNGSIFFDMRPLAGDRQLCDGLRAEVLDEAQHTPRFQKQMALNALQRTVPLNWLGGMDTDDAGTLDLKLQGTAVFVDGARVYALAHGVGLTGTRERIEAVAPLIGVRAAEYGAWVGGFEFLQMLRLRVQLESAGKGGDNRLRVADLNDIDRRILKESFRFARLLQQRLQADYGR